MPLNGMTFLQGGTVATTGGTSKTLTTDGQQVANGIHLIDGSVTDFKVRPNCTVKYKAPTLKPDGTYTKAKMSFVGVRPMLSADGQTHFNLVRTEIEVHPEASATELAYLRSQGAQQLTDVDTDTFWSVGSLA